MIPPRVVVRANGIGQAIRSLGGLLLLGCGSCAPDSDRSPAEHRGAPSYHALLDDLDVVQLDVPDSGFLSSTRTLAQASFTRDVPEPWYEGRWEIAHAKGLERPPRIERAMVREDPAGGGTALALGPESRGLHATFAAPSGPLRVRVRARNALPGAELDATLKVQSLTSPPPPIVDWDAPPPELERRLRPWGLEDPSQRIAFREPDDSHSRDFELRLSFDRWRRGVKISVVVAKGALWLEEVEFSSLGACDALQGMDESLEASAGTAPYVGRVTLGLDVCPSLRILPGWTVGFPVELAAAPARTLLKGYLGAVPCNQDVQAALEVRIGPELVGRIPVELAQGAEPCFQPFTLDLSAFAGREADLRLASSAGAQDVVLVLGSPSLTVAEGAAPSAEQPLRREGRPNVVLISLDTLRADHLGCYGETRPLSPVADRWAAEGTRFANTSSPSSYTLPTHATMMTGQSPRTHQVRIAPSRMHPTETELLAETFQETGEYATAAFTGGGFLNPLFGFDRGFERFSMDDPGGVIRRFGSPADPSAAEGGPGSSAHLASKREPVLRFLDDHAAQPFFLFVHSFLVHNYTADPRYVEAVDPALLPLGAERKEELFAAALGGDGEAAATLEELYAATVMQADRELLGAIEERLEALGILESTVIALVADHGEEFYEHGVMGHGGGLWNTLVHVPFVLKGPGVPKASVREESTSLEDLAPTLLGLAGLPVPPSMQGVDRFAEQQPPERPSLLDLDTRVPEGDERWDGLAVGHHKLLRDFVERETGTAKDQPLRTYLYDLDQDPGERTDLSAADPARARELVLLLERIRNEKDALAPTTSALPLTGDASVDEMLERLGYAQQKRAEAGPKDESGAKDGSR